MPLIFDIRYIDNTIDNMKCPRRIVVLQWIANPRPSGPVGSIPAVGVFFDVS